MLDFIRKMDSMGRIVIPKDLRNKLNVQEDDHLEISFVDNHIEISKYSYNNQLQKVVNFINLTKELINADIYIIFDSGVISDNEMTVPIEILNIINERKEYYSTHIENYSFGKLTFEGYFAIIPLLRDSELIGGMMIISKQAVNSYVKLYVNIVKRFVENLNFL